MVGRVEARQELGQHLLLRHLLQRHKFERRMVELRAPFLYFGCILALYVLRRVSWRADGNIMAPAEIVDGELPVARLVHLLECLFDDVHARLAHWGLQHINATWNIITAWNMIKMTSSPTRITDKHAERHQTRSSCRNSSKLMVPEWSLSNLSKIAL